WPAGAAPLLLALAFAAPWTVLGFWNGALGLWMRHAPRDPVAATAPHMRAADDAAPLAIRVAILMTIRNEAPARRSRSRARSRARRRRGRAASAPPRPSSRRRRGWRPRRRAGRPASRG
ncbi:MAG: hypothetical protein ACKOUS_11750, partial [Alphaproteobacteria bacterium]